MKMFVEPEIKIMDIVVEDVITSSIEGAGGENELPR